MESAGQRSKRRCAPGTANANDDASLPPTDSSEPQRRRQSTFPSSWFASFDKASECPICLNVAMAPVMSMCSQDNGVETLHGVCAVCALTASTDLSATACAICKSPSRRYRGKDPLRLRCSL